MKEITKLRRKGDAEFDSIKRQHQQARILRVPR